MEMPTVGEVHFVVCDVVEFVVHVPRGIDVAMKVIITNINTVSASMYQPIESFRRPPS
jgi:hypothetical protein